MDAIEGRFRGIVQELGLSLDLAPHFEALKIAAKDGDVDFLASRGEYLNARILAEVLGYTFVEAATIIHFNALGQLDMERTLLSRVQLTTGANGYVIPGFYGSLPDGLVKTFSRGGSDLTGAIVAAILDAYLYENWTDVSGLLMADPRIVPDAKCIDTVTYKELRELTYMGATVLHDEVIFPLRKARIPINLRNTNRPEDKGTMIVPDDKVLARSAGSIVGIAGRKDFSVITIEKTLMNQEIGFIRRVCSVFENRGISIEHLPGGIDTLSVIVTSESLNGKFEQIKSALIESCQADAVNVSPNLALICTVGTAMVHTPGVAARLFQAVASAGVSIRMIDQGSSELSIIIGVENADYEKAIRAIYHAFIG
jgi:aspartate kinase